jgi:hypothetical protein
MLCDKNKFILMSRDTETGPKGMPDLLTEQLSFSGRYWYRVFAEQRFLYKRVLIYDIPILV